MAQFAQRGARRFVGREQDHHLLGVGSREVQLFAVEKEGSGGGVAPRLGGGPGEAPAVQAIGELGSGQRCQVGDELLGPL